MSPVPADYQPRPDLLAERTVLVTGAGDGIGRAVAEACAAHGATVVLLGRTVRKLARAVVKAFDADGVTVQQFNEPAGGQVVFHLHVHIIPRFDGVRLKPHTGEMADFGVLAAHADKIRAALS